MDLASWIGVNFLGLIGVLLALLRSAYVGGQTQARTDERLNALEGRLPKLEAQIEQALTEIKADIREIRGDIKEILGSKGAP